MRVIISSKYLQAKLNEFDFEKDYIQSVYSKVGTVYLRGTAEGSIIELDAHHNGQWDSIEQSDAGWIHIKALMNQVDEQPIVLDIAKNSIQVIFQY